MKKVWRCIMTWLHGKACRDRENALRQEVDAVERQTEEAMSKLVSANVKVSIKADESAELDRAMTEGRGLHYKRDQTVRDAEAMFAFFEEIKANRRQP